MKANFRSLMHFDLLHLFRKFQHIHFHRAANRNCFIPGVLTYFKYTLKKHHTLFLTSMWSLMYSFKYTNKMQRYTIFFITVNALRVSGGFSAHHQELKNCTHSIWYVSSLLAATASGSSLTHTRCCVYSFWAPDDGRRNRLKHVEHWQ